MRATIPVLDLTLRQSIATLAVLIGRAPAELTVKGGSLFKLATPRVTRCGNRAAELSEERLRAGLDIVTLLQAEQTWYQQERHPPRWHSVR